MRKNIIHLFSVALLTFLALNMSIATPLDSIGITTKNNKVYIIHQVIAGETLFALSRKYNVAVDDIKKENDNISSLNVGQKVLIPSKHKPSASATPTTTAQTTPKPSTNANGKTHTVKQGETLFSISREYGVSVDEIKQWNNMKDNALSVGQTIIVSKNDAPKSTITNTTQTPTSATTHTVVPSETLFSIAQKYNVSVDELKRLNKMTQNDINVGQKLIIRESSNTSTTTQTTTKPTTTPKVEPKPAVEPKRPNQTQASKDTDTNNKEFNRVSEDGLAMLTKADEFKSKYSYCLHKSAPVGTVIKITDENTGKYIFARVMGKLSANDPAVIHVNQTVIDRIGIANNEFKVKISYVL